MKLIINGRDIIPWVNKRKYFISYIRVEGPGSGTMKDGSDRVDLIKEKSVIRHNMNPLLVPQLTEFLQLCSGPWVFVDYDDPKLGLRRAEMIPTISEAEIVTINGKEYGTGITVTLKER